MAPTPSGFLHIGNAANLLITSWLARTGLLALRVDDMDAVRTRSEYVQDIFDVIEWLGIPWSEGPRDAADQQANYTMSKRTEHYRAGLRQLMDAGVEVFACACSRTDLGGRLVCVGDCRSVAGEFVPGRTALRATLPDVRVEVDGARIDLRREHGDVVLWRRDDLPAYHLVTVLEDRQLGTTDVVRGIDLLPSSALHLWLAEHLEGARSIRYAHHALVRGPMGMKLSKSQGVSSPLPRTEENLDVVLRLARDLADPLGLR